MTFHSTLDEFIATQLNCSLFFGFFKIPYFDIRQVEIISVPYKKVFLLTGKINATYQILSQLYLFVQIIVHALLFLSEIDLLIFQMSRDKGFLFLKNVNINCYLFFQVFQQTSLFFC